MKNTFDIHAPIQEVFAQWTRFTDYPQFMPHVRQVRPIEGARWMWETTDQPWQVEITQQTPQTSIAWRIAAHDHSCDARISLEPIDNEAGTRVVYTAHYPNGFGPHHTAGSVANSMQTTLEQFARLFEDTTQPHAEQDTADTLLSTMQAQQTQAVDDVLAPWSQASAAAADAVREFDEDEIPRVFESATTLQRTLAEATQAWTSSMTKAFASFNALLWSPVESLSQELGPSVRTWSPRFETTQEDGMLLVRSELPGYDAQDLHVEIVDGELLVSGQRHTAPAPADDASTDAAVNVSERFQQRMTLTQPVDARHVQAQVTPSGQLRIALPLKRDALAGASA
ncbi:MAG: SRPBCC family protein [Aquabacterium sp.]